MQIQYGVGKYHAHSLVFCIAPSGMGKTLIKDHVSHASLAANAFLSCWAADGMRMSGAKVGFENGELLFLGNPQTFVRSLLSFI